MTTPSFFLILLVWSLLPPIPVTAQAPSAGLAAFDRYTARQELRLNAQHRSRNAFLVPLDDGLSRLRGGEPVFERLTSAGGSELPGALLHHWRATAFLPGVGASGMERMLAAVDRYPVVIAPEVLRAGMIRHLGPQMEVSLRVRQKHVLTVVMDTDYAIESGRLDSAHGYSTSRSTRIEEIEGAGTPDEHTPASKAGTRLPVAAEHLLELCGSRWRFAGAGGIDLPVARDPVRTGLGGAAVRGECP